MKATVKMFNRDKGFGYIRNGSARDIYVRASELTNCKFLKSGVEVEFEAHIEDNRIVAKNVQLIHKPRNQRNNHNQIQQPRFVMT